MGIDPQLSFRLQDNLQTKIAFTLLTAKDLATKDQLPRRAKVTANWSLFYQLEKHSFIPQVLYVGKRTDVDNLGLKTTMDDHFTFDFNYQYSIHQYCDLSLKIKNLFNVNYEEAFGYGTGGRITTVGAHFNF